MFENLQQSIDRGTSRFERNVARFSSRNQKRLSNWTVHDYRAGGAAILLAAAVTLLEWIAVPFQRLWRLIARR